MARAPDGFLLAGLYTLPDHERTLQRDAEGGRGWLGIVVSGPYGSGALIGGTNFGYAPARLVILTKVARIKAIADRHVSA